MPSYYERAKVFRDLFPPGTKVEVVRAARSNEDGWGNDWADQMDEAVSGVYEIKYHNLIAGVRISFLGSSYAFPLFVLKPVK